MIDILARLLEACNGYPHAKIAWPHRLLHDAHDEIERLKADLLASQEREAAADLRYKDLSVEAADEFNSHHEAMLQEIDQWWLKHQVACDTITRMQSDREAVRARFIASRLEVERLREALKTYGIGCLGVVYHSFENGAIRHLNNHEAGLKGMQIPESIKFAIAKIEEFLSTPPSPDALAAHDREVEEKVFRDTCDICAGIAQTLLRAGDPGEIEETIRRMAAERKAKP